MENINFKKVVVKNFKCHEDAELDFENGKLILVTGVNGAGKTSLLIDSICWALFDETSQGIKGDDVVRNLSGKDCSVEVWFDYCGHEYKIENYRKHKKFKNEKYLYVDGVDKSGSSVKETNEKIQNLLLTKDVFLNCMLFSQNLANSKNFMTLSQSGQKDILDNILGFGEYDEKRKAMIEAINDIKEKLEKINTAEILTKERINTANTSISNLELRQKTREMSTSDEIFKLNDEILGIKNENDRIPFDEKSVQNLNSNKSKINEIIAKKTYEKGHAEEAVKNLDNRLKMAISEKCDPIRNFYSNKLSEETDSLRRSKTELNEKLSHENVSFEKIKLETREKYYTNKSEIENKFNKFVELIDKTLGEINTKNVVLDESIKRINSDIEKLVTEIENLKNETDKKCPTCGQDIKRDNEYKNHVQAEIVKRENDIKSLRNKLKTATQKGEEYKAEEKRLKGDKIKHESEKTAQIQNLHEKSQSTATECKTRHELAVKKLEDSIAKITEELDKISEKTNSIMNEKINKAIMEVESGFESEKTSASMKPAQIQAEIDDLNKTLTNISDEIIKMESLGKKIEENKTKIKMKLNEIESAKKILASEKETTAADIKSHKESIEKLILECERFATLREKAAKKTEILEYWKTAFGDGGIKAVLLDESIPILNKKSLELCKMLPNIRVTFDSQKSLKSGDLRNKFSINPVQTKNLSEYSSLSAGETRMVNIIVLLCLRHLLETMCGKSINVMLFDEIFDSLDDDNSGIVIDMLRMHVDQSRCVLLISHRHKDTINADYVLAL